VLLVFGLIFIFALLVNNRLLINLILVEIIGVIFVILFLSYNIANDGLIVILIRIFILESVLGLVLLLFVLEKTGGDSIRTKFIL